MKKRTIVHVAEVAIREETGMGRIAWHWKREFERRGHEFIHIGPEETGAIRHKALFPKAAYRAWMAMRKQADLFLVHEPVSGAFARRGVCTAVFSHGLERRGWDLTLQGRMELDAPLRLKTRLLFPLWRLRPCDTGLRGADGVLLSNCEDARYAAQKYRIDPRRLRVFRNGVTLFPFEEMPAHGTPRILFLGTWIARKGVRTLAEAAELLARAGVGAEWILAGTSLKEQEVLAGWPAELKSSTTVIPEFNAADEPALLRRGDLLVLPSFLEGQPLALLQAMAAGKCCITSDCCGQKDLIRHGWNGLLHPHGDANALADRIRECVENTDLRVELGRQARLSVADRSWEAVSAETVGLLESLMTEGCFPTG